MARVLPCVKAVLTSNAVRWHILAIRLVQVSKIPVQSLLGHQPSKTE